MKNTLVIQMLLAFGSVLPVKAQQAAQLWLKGLGGNDIDEVSKPTNQLLPDGFILTIGTASTTSSTISTSCVVSSSQGETLFQKYDLNGNLLWEKCYTSLVDSYFLFMFPNSDGSFILGGQNNLGSNRDFKIRKEDGTGTILWSKYYGGSGTEFLRDMIKTEDNGYLMFGESYSNDGDVGSHYGSSSEKDIWILKVDSNGNKVWSKNIGGTLEDRAYAIVNDLHNGCYVVGETISNDNDFIGLHNPGVSGDAYVVRIDSLGTVKWSRLLGGNSWTRGLAATENGTGGVIVASSTACTSGDMHSHIGNSDVWLVNLDSNKNIIWENCYGSIGAEEPTTIRRFNDGSLWVGGISTTISSQVDASYGLSDAWFFQTDNNGNYIKGKVFGGNKDDRATAIYPLNNNMVFVSGYYESGESGIFSIPFYGGYGDVFTAILAPWTTSIQQQGNKPQTIPYPNPAFENVTIDNNSLNIGSIKILDITGKLIFDKTIESAVEQIDISNWPKGVYLLHGILQDGTTCTSRFVHE